MTDFDAIKAIREEILGLTDIRMTLVAMERRAQEELAIAETKHNAAMKIRGFCDAELARKRETLSALQEQAK